MACDRVPRVKTFLLAYYGTPYYRAMLRGLGAALERRGAAVRYLESPGPPEPPSRLRPMMRVANLAGVTDTLAINYGREHLPLPGNVHHHCWVQDLHWTDEPARAMPSQTVWYWVRAWGPKTWLPPAVDAALLARPAAQPGNRVVFAGFVPDIAPEPRHDPFLAARDFSSTSPLVESWPRAERAYLQSTVLRALQRGTALHEVARVTPDRLDIYGLAIPRDLCLWHRGALAPDALLDVFSRAGVNLHLNGDTLIHTRTLECLALGAPVLAEAVRGGDEELAHAGLAGYIHCWEQLSGLAPASEAMLVAPPDLVEARAAIGERHTWDHRAATLMGD